MIHLAILYSVYTQQAYGLGGFRIHFLQFHTFLNVKYIFKTSPHCLPKPHKTTENVSGRIWFQKSFSQEIEYCWNVWGVTCSKVFDWWQTHSIKLPLCNIDILLFSCEIPPWDGYYKTQRKITTVFLHLTIAVCCTIRPDILPNTWEGTQFTEPRRQQGGAVYPNRRPEGP